MKTPKITLVLALTLLSTAVQARLYSGYGIPSYPYLITNAAEMNDIGNNPGDWNKYFKLTVDINLGGYTGVTFNLIGIYRPDIGSYIPFNGVFDGDGHTITNFTYSSTEYYPWNGGWHIAYRGLFKFVQGGTIKNLGLINPQVDALAANANHVGGFVGRCETDSSSAIYLSRCYSTGQVTATNTYYIPYGLVGRISGTTICTSCYWDMTTSGCTESKCGVGKTTEQMMMMATYVGWDFLGYGPEGIWRMCGDGVTYPQLTWAREREGDFACPDGVGIEDLDVLLQAWLQSTGDPCWDSRCDFNGDETVTLPDVSFLAEHWQNE